MATQTDTWFRRTLPPLPRRVRPVQDETLQSFVHRLAQANHIRDDELADYLIPRLAGSQGLHRRFEISLHDLAAVSALDAVYLAQALPDIRSQFTDQDSLHVLGRPTAGHPNRTRLACRRCMAAKNITTRVIVWARHDQNVCLRHQLWISQGVNKPEDQADVADLPEITQSQIRHHNLIRRYGHQPVSHCYSTAQQIIDWSSNLPSPTARWERKRHFFTRQKTEFLPWSYDFAAYYPEVVSVLSVLLSPYWQRMALSDDPAEEQRFYRQIAANGLTNGTPAHNTPLSKWINQHRQDRKPNDDPDGKKFMKQWSFGLSGAVQPDHGPSTGPNPHTKLPQIKWQAAP